MVICGLDHGALFGGVLSPVDQKLRRESGGGLYSLVLTLDSFFD